MNRQEKEELVSSMRQKLEEASIIIVAHQVGLTVEEATRLRRSMKQAGADFKVLKNSLAQIAVQGTRLEGLKSLLIGPTALAFSKDPVAAAKVVVKFANGNEKISVKGGFLDGQILDQNAIRSLAALPSRDELRSKLIAIVNTPATRLAILMKEPATRVARLLATRSS